MLYRHLERERSLWHYFIEDAPVLLTQNIKATRGLVNGAPGLLHSLQFCTDEQQVTYQRAIANGYQETEDGQAVEVEMNAAPTYVNVRVDNTADTRYAWHGVPLPDMQDKIISCVPGAQVVPISTWGADVDADLFDQLHAMKGIPNKLKVREHPFMLAWAMTA